MVFIEIQFDLFFALFKNWVFEFAYKKKITSFSLHRPHRVTEKWQLYNSGGRSRWIYHQALHFHLALSIPQLKSGGRNRQTLPKPAWKTGPATRISTNSQHTTGDSSLSSTSTTSYLQENAVLFSQFSHSPNGPHMPASTPLPPVIFSGNTPIFSRDDWRSFSNPNTTVQKQL